MPAAELLDAAAAHCFDPEIEPHELAVIGGLLLGSSDLFLRVFYLPERERICGQMFDNPLLGQMFDALIAAFARTWQHDTDPQGLWYDIADEDIEEALFGAGLIGPGKLQIPASALDSIRKHSAPVFDFTRFCVKHEGLSSAVAAIRERFRASALTTGNDNLTDTNSEGEATEWAP